MPKFNMPPDLDPKTKNFRNFYGRTRGKKLRNSQKTRFETILPKYRLQGVETGQVDIKAQLPFVEHWLEIGFGGGEHLAHIAMQNPHIGLIGAEIFVNGMAMLLRHIETNNPENVRIHLGDSRDLMDGLADGVLSRIYLLYPDPWPKARHIKRRFISEANLLALARILRPGGELRIASDIPDYINHTLEMLSPDIWREQARDRAQPWDGWFRTRYEQKALDAGRVPQYLIFTKQG